MMNPGQMLEHLLQGGHLGEAGAAHLLGELTAGELAPAMAGALLAAMRAKGVTAAEVRGFAGAMRALARQPALPPSPDAIDIVGTGGDSSGSLNLSTGAALLTAAAGLGVIKHGNRSITSRSGSADLVEEFGLTLPLDERRAAECFAATGFTFLFAPYYHPAMKSLAAVRSALGVQLIGAYDESAAELIANTLVGMGGERAWVVHGAAGWDEATPIGPFVAFDVAAGRVRRELIDPRELGLPRCSAADLKGADAAANWAALRAVLDERDRGAHRAALVLQSGLALFIAGRAGSPAAGIALAGETIDSGRAQAWLERLQQFARPAREEHPA